MTYVLCSTSYMTYMYISGCTTLSSGVAENSAEVWTNTPVDNQDTCYNTGTNTNANTSMLSYHHR